MNFPSSSHSTHICNSYKNFSHIHSNENSRDAFKFLNLTVSCGFKCVVYLIEMMVHRERERKSDKFRIMWAAQIHHSCKCSNPISRVRSFFSFPLLSACVRRWFMFYVLLNACLDIIFNVHFIMTLFWFAPRDLFLKFISLLIFHVRSATYGFVGCFYNHRGWVQWWMNFMWHSGGFYEM